MTNDKRVKEVNVEQQIEVHTQKMYDDMCKLLASRDTELAELKKLNGLDDADLRVFFDNVNMKHELDSLKKKYDGLIEALKSVDKWTLEEMNYRGGDDLIEYRDVNKILKQFNDK